MTWLVVSLLLRKRLQKITEILQWSFKAWVGEDSIIPIPITFQKQARWALGGRIWRTVCCSAHAWYIVPASSLVQDKLWIVVLSPVQHHPNSRSFQSHLHLFPYTMHATWVCPGMGNSECHCEPHDIWWTEVFCVPQQFQFLQRPEIPQNHPMEKLMAILQVCPSYKPPIYERFSSHGCNLNTHSRYIDTFGQDLPKPWPKPGARRETTPPRGPVAVAPQAPPAPMETLEVREMVTCTCRRISIVSIPQWCACWLTDKPQ